MTLANQEKIESYRKNIAEALQILDEIIAIIRFQDNPEDTIIDQKLEEIKKILNQQSRNILRTRYLSHVKTNKIQKFLVNKQKTEEENAKMLGIKELMDN